MSARLEQALRLAAEGHAGQVRRSSNVPYVEHVFAVAWIVDRAGFAEDVVIAGLLHDLVEDTPMTLNEVDARFGTTVAELVGYCSEVKTDPNGQKRPWIERKRDHLAALADAPVAARAIILADKLHNIISIEVDLAEGRDVWSTFNAGREQVLWYYQEAISLCGEGDERLTALAAECRAHLETIVSMAVSKGGTGTSKTRSQSPF